MPRDPSRRRLPALHLDRRSARAAAVLAGRQVVVTTTLGGVLLAAGSPDPVLVTVPLVAGAAATGRADTPTTLLAAAALVVGAWVGWPAEVGALLAAALLSGGLAAALLVAPVVFAALRLTDGDPVPAALAAPGLLLLSLLATFRPAVGVVPVDRLPRPTEIDAALPGPWSREVHGACDLLHLLPPRARLRLTPLAAEVYRASVRLRALDRVLAVGPEVGSGRADLAALRQEVWYRRARALDQLRVEVVRGVEL